MTDEDATPDPNLHIEFTSRSSDGPEVTLENHMLGLGPSILIIPKFSDDGADLTFVVTSVDADPTDTADILELIAEGLRDAVADEATEEG